jgi:hypothetical protein
VTTPASYPDQTQPDQSDLQRERDIYREMVSVLLAQGHALLTEHDLLKLRYARLLAERKAGRS